MQHQEVNTPQSQPIRQVRGPEKRSTDRNQETSEEEQNIRRHQESSSSKDTPSDEVLLFYLDNLSGFSTEFNYHDLSGKALEEYVEYVKSTYEDGENDRTLNNQKQLLDISPGGRLNRLKVQLRNVVDYGILGTEFTMGEVNTMNEMMKKWTLPYIQIGRLAEGGVHI